MDSNSRVGAKPEISNRGGLKCQLCNAFKLRKDHLKLHYIRHHGYDPKVPKSKDAKLKTDLTGYFLSKRCLFSSIQPKYDD